MKKMIGVLLLVVAGVLVSVSSAHAKADVIIDDPCLFINAAGNALVPGEHSQFAITNNGQGVAKGTCKGTIDPPEDGRAVNFFPGYGGPFSDAACDVHGICETTFWHQVVSRSGQAILQCHCNPAAPEE